MKKLFDELSYKVSKTTTKQYSTSFSLGILALSPKIRNPIYAIYGYVRLADEIVDSFHGFDKQKLLSRFRRKQPWLWRKKSLSILFCNHFRKLFTNIRSIFS
jgi:phytoene/squalene synthetase